MQTAHYGERVTILDTALFETVREGEDSTGIHVKHTQFFFVRVTDIVHVSQAQVTTYTVEDFPDTPFA